MKTKRSPLQRKALARMQSARKGRPVHPPCDRVVTTLLRLYRSGQSKAGRQHNPFSLRSVAKRLGVSDRTVRRWCRHKHRPSPERAAALKQFLNL